MAAITHDMRRGIGISLMAAVAFGVSGTFASPLLDAGWSAAALVTCRVAIAAAVLAVPAAIGLRGRWADLLRDRWLIIGYGVVVIAFTQVAYYKAVSHMEVAIALLVEYASPLAVLAWLWLRHGQRPGRVTSIGAAIAMLGLLLVIDISGGGVSTAGIGWGLGAMLGCATYFVLSARASHVPPIALAASGMVLGVLLLLVAGAVGIVDFAASTHDAAFRGVLVPFWLPLLGVGVIATAAAYSLGILGARLAGARLASFVSLFEVVTALAVAWMLLGEAPGPVQALGGLGILAGVVLVKLGEPDAEIAAEPQASVTACPAA